MVSWRVRENGVIFRPAMVIATSAMSAQYVFNPAGSRERLGYVGRAPPPPRPPPPPPLDPEKDAEVYCSEDLLSEDGLSDTPGAADEISLLCDEDISHLRPQFGEERWGSGAEILGDSPYSDPSWSPIPDLSGKLPETPQEKSYWSIEQKSTNLFFAFCGTNPRFKELIQGLSNLVFGAYVGREAPRHTGDLVISGEGGPDFCQLSGRHNYMWTQYFDMDMCGGGNLAYSVLGFKPVRSTSTAVYPDLDWFMHSAQYARMKQIFIELRRYDIFMQMSISFRRENGTYHTELFHNGVYEPSKLFQMLYGDCIHRHPPVPDAYGYATE